MSSHGTIGSSRKRRRSLPLPPLENDAPSNATLPSSRVIPEDLVVEIMLRLPVKSLLRFRCVCKSWKTLISGSYVVNNHLHRSATDPNLLRHRLLGLEYFSDRLRLSRPLRSLIDNPSSSPPLFDDLSFDVGPNSMIVGSCNGLICCLSFDNDYAYYLRYLNPSTRLDSMSPCFPRESRYTIFGFGYDHLGDSYKTVGICCDKIENKTMVKVYALGRDTYWRKIQSLPFFPHSYVPWGYDDCFGKFVSGTLNWLAARPDLSLVVVSVDLGKETCGEVLLPPHLVHEFDVFETCKLWVLGDSLCFSYELSEYQFVLWQMKLYGATESWTILLKFTYLDLLDVGIDNAIDCDFYYFLTPIFLFDKGEVLLQIYGDGKFILYNPRHNSVKHLEFQSDSIQFKGTTHIESLVSPFPSRPVVN